MRPWRPEKGSPEDLPDVSGKGKPPDLGLPPQPPDGRPLDADIDGIERVTFHKCAPERKDSNEDGREAF